MENALSGRIGVDLNSIHSIVLGRWLAGRWLFLVCGSDNEHLSADGRTAGVFVRRWRISFWRFGTCDRAVLPLVRERDERERKFKLARNVWKLVAPQTPR